MLGTNDTKTRYGVNTVEIGYGLDEVLLKIEETCRRKSQTPEKIVIAPADLYPKKDWIAFTAESAQKAGGLTEEHCRASSCRIFECTRGAWGRVYWL